MGSFTLSVYFKSELTSWLVARIPEPVVDDLIKLETALDAHAIRPCVTRDIPRDLAIPDSGGTGVMRKLERSLGPRREEVTFQDCFKCALKKGRLCFTVRQMPCVMRAFFPRFIESRDPLALVYAGVLVRKHYRLRMAFRSLVQRVDETAEGGTAISLSASSASLQRFVSPTEVSTMRTPVEEEFSQQDAVETRRRRAEQLLHVTQQLARRPVPKFRFMEKSLKTLDL
ncbi:hypothetical protein HPB47_018377 [Ixodes persulcatus]|uniref:Uncharacterized protein n=1 Tax=Ixodes persulcatus TaxID=34615 RepID=A0AC60QKX3_IXOPE|nr:hypothetical protein HPB47_018377 [Ixodes persulcatus]